MPLSLLAVATCVALSPITPARPDAPAARLSVHTDALRARTLAEGVAFAPAAFAALTPGDPLPAAFDALGARVEAGRATAAVLAVGASHGLVRDEAELTASLSEWLSDVESARAAGEAGLQILLRHAGATARTADALERFLG